MKLLIFSLKTLRQVSLLCGVEDVPEASIFENSGGTASRNNMNKRQKLANGNSSVGISESNPVWHELMERLFNKLGGRVNIACCFKTRDSNGVQTRWSTIVDSNGIHTTKDIPTIHLPKDECGGGSAWAAGCLDAYLKTH